MPKEPFDVNRDLGVPPVDWNKVTSIGCEGPKRYPTELTEITPEFRAAAEIEANTPITITKTIEMDWVNEVRKTAIEFSEKAKAAEEALKPLEEPLGETPKFNPVTQQFELPE